MLTNAPEASAFSSSRRIWCLNHGGQADPSCLGLFASPSSHLFRQQHIPIRAGMNGENSHDRVILLRFTPGETTSARQPDAWFAARLVLDASALLSDASALLSDASAQLKCHFFMLTFPKRSFLFHPPTIKDAISHPPCPMGRISRMAS